MYAVAYIRVRREIKNGATVLAHIIGGNERYTPSKDAGKCGEDYITSFLGPVCRIVNQHKPQNPQHTFEEHIASSIKVMADAVLQAPTTTYPTSMDIDQHGECYPKRTNGLAYFFVGGGGGHAFHFLFDNKKNEYPTCA